MEESGRDVMWHYPGMCVEGLKKIRKPRSGQSVTWRHLAKRQCQNCCVWWVAEIKRLKSERITQTDGQAQSPTMPCVADG